MDNMSIMAARRSSSFVLDPTRRALLFRSPERKSGKREREGGAINMVPIEACPGNDARYAARQSVTAFSRASLASEIVESRLRSTAKQTF